MNKLISIVCAIMLITVNTMGQQRTHSQDTLLYNVFPAIEGKAVYEKIIEAPGKSKSDIYKIIKTWAASAFISQKDALQTDDLNTGLIIYKYNFTSSFESPKIDNLSSTVETRYWQNLKLFIKDERLKVIVDNLKVDIGEASHSVSTYEADQKAFTENAIQEYKKKMKVSEKMEAKMRDNAARYDKAVINNFSVADKEIKELIKSIEKTITSKSDFDF